MVVASKLRKWPSAARQTPTIVSLPPPGAASMPRPIPRRPLSPAAADAPGLLERAIRASGVRHAYWSLATRQARHRPYLQLLERCVELDGDVIECGVFHGKSLLRIATWLKHRGSRKTIYGLDSFEGFPVDEIGEIDVGPGRTMHNVRHRFR